MRHTHDGHEHEHPDPSGHVHEHEHDSVDALRALGLDIHRWGYRDPSGLIRPYSDLPVPMYGAPASGLGLAGGDALGVDLINVRAGGGFSPHTHPGDHLLIIVAGRGTVTWDGRIWPTSPGSVYFIPGEAPHAVGAIEDHTILAVGSPHKPIGAADRQALTAYDAVASSLGALTCLACTPPRTGSPAALRADGCRHAPDDTIARQKAVVVLPWARRDGDPLTGTKGGAVIADALAAPRGTEALYVDTAVLSPYRQIATDLRPVDLSAPAADLIARSPGRVLVATSGEVCRSLDGPAQVSAWLTGTSADPTLIISCPLKARYRTLLATAVTLAAGGPPSGIWTEADVEAVLAVKSAL